MRFSPPASSSAPQPPQSADASAPEYRQHPPSQPAAARAPQSPDILPSPAQRTPDSAAQTGSRQDVSPHSCVWPDPPTHDSPTHDSPNCDSPKPDSPRAPPADSSA